MKKNEGKESGCGGYRDKLGPGCARPRGWHRKRRYRAFEVGDLGFRVQDLGFRV